MLRRIDVELVTRAFRIGDALVTLMPLRGASAFSAPIGEQECSSSTASSEW